MKKLLSIMTALTLTGSAGTTLVACSSTDTKHLNDKGNSIWAELPGLDGGKNNPDSADVWNEMDPFGGASADPTNPNNWDGAVQSTVTIQILKMLSVSILANAEKIFGSGGGAPKTNIAGYSDGFVKQLESDWTQLKTAVNNEVANQKESYKEQYGKDWEKHWNDMLKNDYDGSENNYRAYLFAEGKDTNASMMLTNTLIGQGAFNSSTVNMATLGSYRKAWATASTQPGGSTTWANSNPAEARELALSMTSYRSKDGTIPNIWKNDQTNNISLENDVIPALESLAKDLSKAVVLYAVPVKTYDSSNKKYSERSNGFTHSSGLISAFQNFALQKWYSEEKPLAISTITIDYRPGGDPKSGQKGLDAGTDDPGRLFNDTQETQINQILGKLSDGTTTWNDLRSGEYGGIKPTYGSSLLTVDPGDGKTYNTNLSASVYGAINSLTAGSGISTLPSKIGDDDGLLASINRSQSATWDGTAIDPVKPGTMYKVYNIAQPSSATGAPDPVVVYLDDTGLNLVHIEGLEAWNSQTTKTNTAGPENTTTANQDADNFNYNLSRGQAQSGSLAQETPAQLMGDDKSNTAATAFNYGIYNKYLQYLVNQSYINTLPGSYQKFNILTTMQAYATLDSSSKAGNHLWFTWMYDFFKNYFTKIATTTQTDWLNNFITFNPKSSKSSNDNATIAQWFEDTIANNNSSLNTYPSSALATAIEKANETIGSNAAKPQSRYPDGTYWTNNVLDAILYQLNNNITPNKIWQTKEQS